MLLGYMNVFPMSGILYNMSGGDNHNLCAVVCPSSQLLSRDMGFTGNMECSACLHNICVCPNGSLGLFHNGPHCSFIMTQNIMTHVCVNMFL